ncbi:ATP-binding protein [Kordia sp. YSTF-M3]|uniref:ATP-binding protein n=1 Tax=Kordia aestuariivivens TaxID=2759037 RepID=A0ABR7Q6Z9_9FLAO|nr:ATP-binding protein [Kordia aestuariivivens]MBC8754335.1 ATP-binding protein [Kordia aestuariivivens]
METSEYNLSIHQEIDWLQNVINQVISSYLQHEGVEAHWTELPMPDIEAIDSPFANTIKEWNLNNLERLALILAIAPHIRPEALDIFFGQNKIYNRGFTEFGGVIDKGHSGFLPTGQTLFFLITAVNPEWQIEVLSYFNNDHIFQKEQLLSLESTESYLPKFNGVLSINHRWLHYFMTGEKPKLEHSITFPAQKITTNLEWDDMVLNPAIMDQVTELKTWILHKDTLLDDWGLSKHLKPGYRALFYGPPGTGKTLTVSLLGKNLEMDVYRVDLSMIVSKYIGETEKNLSRIFDTAAHQNWILFFDEADALFGKRTQANSSNDRHANQQTAYLLQRIEDFPGTVILASNLKANMDQAFSRRFQAMINFKMPTKEERLKLWGKAFSGTCTLSPEIDLNSIAEHYELAGGAIINVLRYCALAAIQRGDTVVNKQELLVGIRKELKKENKTITQP